MTDKELKQYYVDELNKKFESLLPYSYRGIDYDEIKKKREELEEKIYQIPFKELKEIKVDGDDYLIEFDEFVNSFEKQDSKLTSREIFISNVKEITSKVINKFSTVWNYIKFLFSIPALTFASFIITMAFIVIFSIPLNLVFPQGFSDEYLGLTESIICAITYVSLKVAIILDVHDRYLEENIVVYLIKCVVAIAIYWTMFFIIRFQVINNFFDMNIGERLFFTPFTFLGCITNEYFNSGLLCYFLITFMPLIISIPIILFREFNYKKINKKNIEYFKKKENEDDSYDYHFDSSFDIQYLDKREIKSKKK